MNASAPRVSVLRFRWSNTGVSNKSMFHTPDTPVIEGASNHKIAVENVYFRMGKSNHSGYETLSKKKRLGYGDKKVMSKRARSI